MLHTLIKSVHTVQDRLGMPVNYTMREFRDFKSQLDWSSIDADRVAQLARIFNKPAEEIAAFVDEAEAVECEELDETPADDWSGVGNPMGRTDRLTLYVAVRAFAPRLAVETGTAAGASARYILSAMERNGLGRLISVDATRDRRNVGRLIPDNLRPRVELIGGNSLEVLGRCDLTALDFFLHDSRHTYRHMTAEYELAFTHFAPRAVLCSHDVLMTNAWPHAIARHDVRQSAIIKNFGVLLAEQ